MYHVGVTVSVMRSTMKALSSSWKAEITSGGSAVARAATTLVKAG